MARENQNLKTLEWCYQTMVEDKYELKSLSNFQLHYQGSTLLSNKTALTFVIFLGLATKVTASYHSVLTLTFTKVQCFCVSFP